MRMRNNINYMKSFTDCNIRKKNTMAFLGVISWRLFVDAFRLLSIVSFLLCSLSFNFYSFGSLICILVSLYLLDRNKYVEESRVDDDNGFKFHNPYSKRKRVREEEKLPPSVVNKYVEGLLDFVLYDVEDNEAVRNFRPIQNNTHCIFSKKATVWGARDYDPELTLEHNVSRSLAALLKFLLVGLDLRLDGFVFELPGQEFCKDLDSFGRGVYRVLKCISDADPSGYHCMNKSFLSKKGWGFEFAQIQIFVTTFSACYPESHSRYSFGVESSFILLQPMYSFAIHDISTDTPNTNWECPKTERDHIRVAFKNNGRGYLIRDTVIYPPAHDIVKPLVEGPDNVHEWWKASGSKEDEKKLEAEKRSRSEFEQETFGSEDTVVEHMTEKLKEDIQEDSEEIGIASDEDKKHK